ncbi:hypothetical protein CXB51_021825 [Gossypium anomalum]|uniref:DUF7745 domain-containing protein n=2 Tax=Gossypium TaxID=3633 RepID=A0A8J5YAE9_9ROSI|nr:hypothetical protein CXB51_021825 [Gossypium anomalum]
MEKGFLDRVEDNAAVRVWFEKTQREKGDSLAEGYESELWDFTRINVTQNDLRELREIWNSWNDEIKQLFYCNYGDLPYLLDIKKGDSKCIPWGNLRDLILAHPDLKKRVDVFALSLYGLIIFPKALGHIDEAVSDLFDRLDKGTTPVPAILAETFRSLNACRRAGEGRFIGCAQLLLAWFHSHFWKVDKNLQAENVEWRAPWLIPGEILYRCGNFDWVPLAGIWGASGYTPLPVLRQYRSRQFIPATQGLAQCKFSYKDDGYKKKVREISDAWNQTRRMKGFTAGPMITPEYEWWWAPSELEIIKQDFERKSSEFRKSIEQLEEEKMRLGLDVDIHKLEAEKLRKGKNKAEEDLDSLKTAYKKLRMSIRTAGLGKTSEQWRQEIGKEKTRADQWEKNRNSVIELKASLSRIEELKEEIGKLEAALQDGKIRVELLEANNEHYREQLFRSQDQIRNRDYFMGEAVAQVREVTDHLQTLAVQADVLSLKYESESDRGRNLAWLFRKVKALGIRAKSSM